MEVRRLAPQLDVSRISWVGDRLLYAGIAGLETMCGFLSPAGLDESLWRGPATIGLRHFPRISASTDGRTVAAAYDAPGEPPELRLLEATESGTTWRALSSFNAALAHLDAPQVERVSWAAPDGLEIEGLLLRPHLPPAGPRGATAHRWWSPTPATARSATSAPA
jgi:hypothetical protein